MFLRVITDRPKPPSLRGQADTLPWKGKKHGMLMAEIQPVEVGS